MIKPYDIVWARIVAEKNEKKLDDAIRKVNADIERASQEGHFSCLISPDFFKEIKQIFKQEQYKVYVGSDGYCRISWERKRKLFERKNDK